MGEILSFQGKKNPGWLNQYSATSGNIPSAAAIDQMIQSELDSAYKNRYYGGILQLQKDNLDYTKTKDARDYEQKQREIDDRKTTGLIAGATGLATAGLGLLGKKGTEKVGGWLVDAPGKAWDKGVGMVQNLWNKPKEITSGDGGYAFENNNFRESLNPEIRLNPEDYLTNTKPPKDYFMGDTENTNFNILDL